MKRILKYIFLFIVAFAFHQGAKDGFAVNEESFQNDVHEVFSVSSHLSLSSPETEFSLPRQISSVNAPRFQNDGRRHETSHRQNLTFVKSGKTINPVVRYTVQQQSSLFHSPHIRPYNRLRSLGRLII